MILGNSYEGYWIEHDTDTIYYIVIISGHELYCAFTRQEAMDYIDNRY